MEHNEAVDRMYQIIDHIDSNHPEQGVIELAKLLDIKINRINIWTAIHMLEKVKINDNIEKKALDIIKEESKYSYGMKLWINEYMNKDN